MDKKSSKLDYWRDYFRSANSNIFEVIENAILVAASDCPNEFQVRRDRIAEKLFSCRMSRCFGCDRLELVVPHKEDEEVEEERDVSKGKVNSSSNEVEEINRVSNYSYDEAEALTEEIEEENQIVGEVIRIKGVLTNYKEESDSVLFDSLRRLQLIGLTVELLKATEIGKAVNLLRKCGSKQIRQLARTLIDEWKDMVDEWVNTTAAIPGDTPESVNPSVVDEEEGLPFPPLDEGAFFTTQPTSIELLQFFDGMDDDGNPQNIGEPNKNHDNVRKTGPEDYNRKRKQQMSYESNVPKEDKSHVTKEETVGNQSKPSNNDFGPGRPPKLSSNQKANDDRKLFKQPEPCLVQKKPMTNQQHNPMYLDDIVRMKLEASGRNLQERYQQLENAKKQRTIQVMELHDLPKQRLNQRPSFFKPGVYNRHWANGRR